MQTEVNALTCFAKVDQSNGPTSSFSIDGESGKQNIFATISKVYLFIYLFVYFLKAKLPAEEFFKIVNTFVTHVKEG
jgi:hypothetical protein